MPRKPGSRRPRTVLPFRSPRCHRPRPWLSQWTKDGGQFIPHPATWLRQERWTDEPVQRETAAERIARLMPTEERTMDTTQARECLSLLLSGAGVVPDESERDAWLSDVFLSAPNRDRMLNCDPAGLDGEPLPEVDRRLDDNPRNTDPGEKQGPAPNRTSPTRTDTPGAGYSAWSAHDRPGRMGCACPSLRQQAPYRQPGQVAADRGGNADQHQRMLWRTWQIGMSRMRPSRSLQTKAPARTGAG